MNREYQPSIGLLKNSKREDLLNFELMISLGFSPQYSHADIMHKREIPHDTVSYRKDNLYVWRIFTNNGNQWTSANLNDGRHFCNHKQYKTLNNFLKDINLI